MSETTALAEPNDDATLSIKRNITPAMRRAAKWSTACSDEVTTSLGSGAISSDVIEQMPVVPEVPLKVPPDLGRFVLLGEFRGVVVEVLDDSFWARWRELTSGETEEGEFPLDEISLADRSLVREGAEFYWYIGFADSPAGTRSRQSILRFRRMPSLTSVERASAERHADQLMARFSNGTAR
ncbi:MAG: hypothetical protein KC503_00845 [Myxococcales bacterium]|nr:hypothetical protein [Myxococcales bacterium]